MPNTRSEGNERSALCSYIRQMQKSETKTAKYLATAMKDELTEKQLRVVLMYYGGQMSMAQIAQELGVNKSTVSRTIRRGRDKLKLCLKYGARELLFSAIDGDDDGFVLPGRAVR